MDRAVRGAAYTAAAWTLRIALVAYGTLVVTIRYPEAIPEPEVEGFTAERAYWLLILLLTAAPFVYALLRTWRGLFLPALLLACYATFEALVMPASAMDYLRTEDYPGEYLLYSAGRLVLLAGLWAATVIVARLERPRRRRDWAIVLAFFLIFCIPNLGLLYQYLLWSSTPRFEPSSRWLQDGLVLFATVLAALTLRDAGWPRTPAKEARPSPLVLGLLGGVVAMLGAVGFTTLRTASLPDLSSVQWPGMESLFAYGVIAPVLEEWGFRGVLWATCRRRFGTVGTLFLTSTAFGLLHLSVGPTCRMPEQIVMGFVFGAIRWKTGTLWAPIVAHALGNLLIFLVW